MEKEFLKRSWIQVKDFVEVKRLPEQGELYILALSQRRRQKERAMRRHSRERHSFVSLRAATQRKHNLFRG